MAHTIESVMTSDPQCCDVGVPLVEAAKLMDQHDIGDVLVTQNGELCGIVTDRDIAIRAVAHGKDPSSTTLGDVCSRDPITLSPDESIDDAIATMRERAVRRVPVVDGGRPVGVVSLGDLAEERDRRSVLADISAAPANN